MHKFKFIITTKGRGLIDITNDIARYLTKSEITEGLCHVFLHHTSASLILCENYDPLVLEDLNEFMLRLVPDDDSLYQHTAEGSDDMPAHIRAVLTHHFLMIPITQGKLDLGSWQGIYLWEHRFKGHSRTITVSLL